MQQRLRADGHPISSTLEVHGFVVDGEKRRRQLLPPLQALAVYLFSTVFFFF
jgi:hypothetical protein